MEWLGGAVLWMFFGLIWTIIIGGGVIALIVWLVIRLTRGSQGKQSALDLARTRYAKGEISREEFDQLKKDLQ
ncbi:MAG: SHOCT domain-containing protein [Chloroflexi bacterium]|nr:SHOCT domain-containing protein [Chloroflexota bacterium]